MLESPAHLLDSRQGPGRPDMFGEQGGQLPAKQLKADLGVLFRIVECRLLQGMVVQPAACRRRKKGEKRQDQYDDPQSHGLAGLPAVPKQRLPGCRGWNLRVSGSFISSPVWPAFPGLDKDLSDYRKQKGEVKRYEKHQILAIRDHSG